MLISSLLVTFKLASALAKEMVYFEAAKRIAPNLLQAGRQWILDSLTDQHQQQQLREQDANREANEEQHVAASTEYLVHNWLEALFAWFQVIVLWHEPYISLCALSGLFSSFLLLTYFAPRFYATIMIALFIYNANKFWFRHVWPAIRVPPGSEREEEMRLDVDRWTYLHPQLMTLAEFGQHIRNLRKISEQHVQKLLKLRQERPVTFCSLVCSTLSCTAYIGNRISGMSLIFLSTTAFVSAPGIYLHLLPENTKYWIRQNVGLRIIKSVQSESDEQTTESSSLESPATTATETNYTPESSSLLKSKAKSIESHALSILEHFTRKSFMCRQESTDPEPSSQGNDNKSASTIGCIPIVDEDRQPEVSPNNQQQQIEDMTTSGLKYRQEPRKSSDDMSSNDSVSLIDSEDDQQDGFVLL